VAIISKTKEQLIVEKRDRQVNGIYTEARDWAKEGAELLERGLREKRSGNFTEARSSLNGALANFREAIDKYNLALNFLPNQKMQDRIYRKIEGLQNCDIACAKNALSRMMPKTEPPMESGGIIIRSRII